VYPFNPNAIDCRLAAGKGDGGEGGMTKPSEGGSGDQDETHEGESDGHGGSEDRWRGESNELGGSVSEEMQFDPSVNQRKEELYQDALKATIFMIMSIFSGWKRTIQSPYLPIGTHWCQHLNSSLQSVTSLATSVHWRALS
jgi:hypothetical protein